jgi:hypothetical protein
MQLMSFFPLLLSTDAVCHLRVAKKCSKKVTWLCVFAIQYVFALCRCNREKRVCDVVPEPPGTECGEYGLGQCNQGPGFCRVISRETGSFALCVGVPRVGAKCDDSNVCTKNDRCKVAMTNDGFFRGQCTGDVNEDYSCDSYGGDQCVVNFRYSSDSLLPVAPH